MNTLALLALFAVQDSPVDIAKADLPKTAICIVCTAGGETHGEEKPAAGVRFKGANYYFCNAKEVAGFKKDPEAFFPPVLPRPAPAFELADLSGKTWNAESLKGKVVLIDFWATWCVPCKEMKPIIDKVRTEFTEKGFEVLSVSIDEKRPTLDQFIKKTPFSNPVLFDDKQTWSTWKVRVVPTFFVVKDGVIVGQWSGKRPEKEVREAIATALRN